MKKYIVLSANENPEYLFYLPLTVWAWRRFGWEPMVFYQGKPNNFTDLIERTFDLLHGGMTAEMKGLYRLKSFIVESIEGYKSDTIAQISRLYAACCSFSENDFLMTGDIDMIPLSDYWKFNENEITVWGRDLTDYHYPICYIGMSTSNWIKVMNLKNGVCNPYQHNEFIKRDLDSMPNAKSEDSVKRWVVDQDLITERVNNCGLPITKVNRSMYANGYPLGRVDRSAWTLNHAQLIDCHMPRGIYSDWTSQMKMMDLLYTIWPNESFAWFTQYIIEFKKLVNG